LQIYFRKKITTDSLALHIYQQSPFFSVGEDKDEVGNKRLLKNNFDTILKIETATDSINWKRTRLNVTANFQIKNSAAKADETSGRQNSMFSSSSNSTKKIKEKFADELNFSQPMFLNFNHPIATENLKTNFVLIEDTGKFKTTAKPQLLNDSAFQQKVKINYNFKEDHLYEIVGRKNQLTDAANIQSDSFHISFIYKAQRHFGNIVLAIKTDSLPHHWIVQLLNNNGVEAAREKFANKKISWNNLSQGQYNIRILNDENDNGKWDTGNYFLHQQPESYLRYTNDVLVKPNWDTELDWKIK
jgi:uncharacterized protein (DUF2141 family)